ncbi:hypothetical protein B566_EDAN012211 [Ephemera danica]|nr:hypothetical protein B566_EDAN012211 [Ephemera danica]
MSYTNILEGARQYFQGLPSANTNNNSSNPAGQRNAGNEAGNVAPQSPAGAPPPQPAVTQQPQQPPPVLQQPQQPQAAPQWPSHSAPGQPPPAPDLRWAKPLDATQAQYVYPQYNVPQQQQQQQQQPQTKYPAEMYNNVAQKNNYNNFTQQQSGKSHNNVAYQYQEKSKQPVVANSYMYNHTAPVSRGQQQAYDVKSSIPTPVSRVSGQQQAYDVKSSIASPVSRGQQQVYDVKSSIPRAPSNHDGRHYERNSMVNSSSGQSNYPTMGSIDRAFAQYSSPKMLPTTSSPAPTANSFLANRPSTSYPAHYPANMSRPVHSKPASHYQEQMTQPSPKQQQQTQQFNQKLHQYYQYNSQLMPTTQQQQQQQYPTMTNPTASWVQSAMGQQQQQYRQVSQQQQQQQQQALPQHQIQQQFAQPAARQQTPHHPMVSEANSSQHLVSMAHHMSKERPLQHDQHAQMLQRPKLPPPRPQQTPRAPGVRRDSPLDLSVRTIRRSADSTLDDERGTPEHPLAPPPDTSRMQQPDLSLQSLLRSSENALLPPFQRFRQG